MRTSREMGPGCSSQTWLTLAGLPVTVCFFLIHLVTCPSSRAESLKSKLDAAPLKIAYESYVSNNWEIFVCDANGSNLTNLTRTPGANEHCPQVSPDGTQIAFTREDGEGRSAVRSLWVMDIDGRSRRKRSTRIPA